MRVRMRRKTDRLRIKKQEELIEIHKKQEKKSKTTKQNQLSQWMVCYKFNFFSSLFNFTFKLYIVQMYAYAMCLLY